MNLYVHPNSLTPLKEWCKDLETENIDWVAVFNNTFISITNNYRLIQFQYKLLMRISTSRYMRFKMSIVRDNPICCNCKLHLETLAHIFLKCSHTKSFISILRSFILLKIDPTYRDQNCKYFITVTHSNQIINYLNMIAKWYISRQFQNEQPLAWDSFKRLISLAWWGRESVLRKPLITSCSSRLWQCIGFFESGFRTVRILHARISLFLYSLKY